MTHPNILASRKEHLDRVNGALSKTGFRVWKMISTSSGKKPSRPFVLEGPSGVIGYYEWLDNAHQKALRLLGKCK